MQRRAAMMCCFLFVAFISLTSLSRAQFVPTSGLEEEKFSSRPSPANVTQESTDNLKEKGYVTIGQIFLKEEGKKCWGANCATSLSCPSGTIKKDLTRKLLEQAASRGGDLVILSRDNFIAKGHVLKDGKCTSKRRVRKSIPFSVNKGGVWSTEMKTVEVDECASWERIDGYQCVLQSHGTVLRLDPGLDKRIAARYSERLAKHTAKFEEISFRLSAQAFVAETQRDPAAPTLAYENGKWGYRDRNGKIVIPPQFDAARSFSEGLAMVWTEGRMGFIDKAGNFAIKPQFNAGSEGFSQGLAAVGFSPGTLSFKWGYIDTKGEFAIPAQFDSAEPFSEGLAAVAVGELFKPDRWGYIDKAGNWAIRPSFYEAKEFSENLAPVAIGNMIKRKWGYINKDGAVMIQSEFDDAGQFSEGLAPIAVGIGLTEKKWGYVNKDGQVVIQPAFSEADPFSDGLARVRVGGKCGYIDKKGDFVIKPQFGMAGAFVNNEARVLIDDTVTYIDKSGNISALAQ